MWSDGYVTPKDWRCLDGTLYVGATLQETTDVRSAVMAKMPISSL